MAVPARRILKPGLSAGTMTKIPTKHEIAEATTQDANMVVAPLPDPRAITGATTSGILTISW